MNDMMEVSARLAASNIQGLAQLVREMRLTQTGYFKTRSQQTLLESKQLEKTVDLAIQLILGDTKQKEMPL